jgi:hypothetical protein
MMKIAAMALMVAMVGVAAEPKQPQRVTVYLRDNGVVPPGVEAQALGLANQMFGTIGIRLDWRIGEPPRTQSAQPIFIELATETPANLLPGALAYALPYEGLHIKVFYDRVWGVRDRSVRAMLLAHVLVHEITHVLEGIDRHSDSGVMKARWTGEDYFQMRTGALPFAPQDVALIHLGLAGSGSATNPAK